MESASLGVAKKHKKLIPKKRRKEKEKNPFMLKVSRWASGLMPCLHQIKFTTDIDKFN